MTKQELEVIAGIASMWCEISGYVSGLTIASGAWIPAFHRVKGYTAKLVTIALTSLMLAIVTPVLVDCLGSINLMAATLVGCLSASAILFSGIWAFVLPMRIALRRDRTHAKAVIILNLLFFVPLSWQWALLWATAPERNDASGSVPTLGPAISDQYIQSAPQLMASDPVYQDVERLEQMLLTVEAGKEADRIGKLLRQPMERSEKLVKLKDALTDFLLASDWPDEIGDVMRTSLEKLHGD